MYSLFIDTHDSLITVALINEEEIIAKQIESEKSHSIHLLPLIEKLFEEKNINSDELKEILVVNGPGSFTGIRIGLSVAKTMGYAKNIPVKPITSLEMYLISSELNNPLIIIEDNKGYYIKAKDIIEQYTTDINEFINNYQVNENRINLRKIYNNLKNKTPINIHELKAKYIKKIEVEK